MELDDDFFILDREKADHTWRKKEAPISSFSGDESVASHFALVTAYEDIKKRLKECEKENSFLKKRVRLLEDQVKVNADTLKAFNEQLQTKEVELLQLKTELETQQVMKNLNSTPNDWEVDKLNSALKVCNLEQEMELLRSECLRLKSELQNNKQKDQTSNGRLPDKEDEATHSDMQQAFWELKKEMSNLHLVTEVQAEVLRKLRASLAATKKALPVAPVQCVEDLETDYMKLRLTSSGAEYKKQTYFLPPEDGNIFWATGDVKYPYSKISPARTEERPIPVGGPAYPDHDSYGKSSFDDSSWVFSGSPKPSDSSFWEAKSSPSPPNTPTYFFAKRSDSSLPKS
ncbi:5-azacytidine-induced protein 2 isoform X2 [Ambystoma mexicanum]|uniref:5-azacytidine-induced protein 2 isoform X2 n=1 Tax=Ambystoma mexicanum TaxID=8296 RepID=UPI0037E9A15A